MRLNGNLNTDEQLQGFLNIGKILDKIEIDDELSLTSENPVQNKIITAELLKNGVKKVNSLEIETTDMGVYVTKEVRSSGLVYVSPNFPLIVIVGEIISMIGQPPDRFATVISRDKIFNFHNGIETPYFSNKVANNDLNAPTSKAVYEAIQEALLVNTEEVIE